MERHNPAHLALIDDLSHTPPMTDRSILVTVLFTDIVGSTTIAEEMGDRRWRELLARHHRIVRTELRRHGGREIDTAGDGFFAAFDRPAQAVRCAASIVQAVRTLGIEVRAGVHAGEAEVMGRGLGGIAVHTGARLAALAGPGEVLVSGTLRELVPGATFAFEDRGVQELKGIREAPRAFAVAEVDETPLGTPLSEEEARERRGAIEPPPAYKRRPIWITAVVAGLVVTGALAFVLTRPNEPAPPAGAVHDVAVRVDPAVGAVRTVAPLPHANPVDLHNAQVTVGEGAVWILNSECLCRVDPENGEVGRVDVLLPRQMSLGHRAVWTATLYAEVYAVNPSSLEPSEPFILPNESADISITTTDDAVWVALGRELTPIDPLSVTPGDPILLDHGADNIIGVGRNVWFVDELARTLYLHGPDGGQIDPPVELPFTPDDVAAGPDGSLWVLNRSGGTVTRVDANGGLGQPIRVGADPTDVAVGPDDVWVADHDGHTIQRIDPTLGQRDPPIRLPGPVAAIGVDPATGEVWAYLN